MLKRKSQASLEYLTTYAWAFVILVVAIGAIQYFDLLDFQKYLPQKCVFSSQFECSEYTLGNGEIRLKVINNIGVNLKLQNVFIGNKEIPPLKCEGTMLVNGNELTGDIDWPHGDGIDIRFSGCRDGGYMPGERVEAHITLRYYSPDTMRASSLRAPIFHDVRGKVEALIRKS